MGLHWEQTKASQLAKETEHEKAVMKEPRRESQMGKELGLL